MHEVINLCVEIGFEVLKETVLVVRDALVLKLTVYGVAGLGLHLLRELL
jgi:hypothetical protein